MTAVKANSNNVEEVLRSKLTRALNPNGIKDPTTLAIAKTASLTDFIDSAIEEWFGCQAHEAEDTEMIAFAFGYLMEDLASAHADKDMAAKFQQQFALGRLI